MNVMECRELHHPIAQLETQGGHVVKWCGPNLSPSIDWPQACQLCGPNISNSASIRHRPNYVDVWPGLPLCIAPSLLHHSNICIHPSSVISHSNKFAHSSPGPCADNTTDGPGNHLHTPRVSVLLAVMSRAVPQSRVLTTEGNIQPGLVTQSDLETGNLRLNSCWFGRFL